MNNKYDKIYIAIDLKSFYASVECQERGLNPLTTNTCSSYDDIALKKNNDLELSYIVALPRMSYYMQYSTKIVNIYLK